MKKILIITGSFGIGGSRTSLYSLLSVLNTNQVQVDLFSREHVGPLKGSIPNCRVLPETVWLSHRIYDGNKFQKWACLVLYYLRGILQNVGIDLFKLYNYIGGKHIGSEQYDAVIGFDETQSRYLSAIPAKKRIIWLHSDYRRYVNGRNESKYYEKIDNVVCVSKFAKEAFVAALPQYESKVVIIRNAINIEGIIAKSKLVTPEVETLFPRKEIKPFTIISIGRLDPVKQFEKIPAIAVDVKKRLNDDVRFRWLIIGGGDVFVKREIEDEISKYHVEDEVLLLGEQANPYPYLAKSDLYVCTSLSETFSYSIHEGLVLKVPFLCNNFKGADDSVHVGNEGYVLPIADMPARIVELINKPLHIGDCFISNRELLETFYNLI